MLFIFFALLLIMFLLITLFFNFNITFVIDNYEGYHKNG
ncbi:hypothetical protein yfred0001_37720 [Yersinia frederiksenii ATCC 33641]|nr:hypothetical protein yfred0001_37720 [Yersinia frederiksenii ATCC 33641]